jgi:hypothetical protein
MEIKITNVKDEGDGLDRLYFEYDSLKFTERQIADAIYRKFGEYINLAMGCSRYGNFWLPSCQLQKGDSVYLDTNKTKVEDIVTYLSPSPNTVGGSMEIDAIVTGINTYKRPCGEDIVESYDLLIEGHPTGFVTATVDRHRVRAKSLDSISY